MEREMTKAMSREQSQTLSMQDPAIVSLFLVQKVLESRNGGIPAAWNTTSALKIFKLSSNQTNISFSWRAQIFTEHTTSRSKSKKIWTRGVAEIQVRKNGKHHVILGTRSLQRQASSGFHNGHYYSASIII
jgi:ribosomal protein S21